VFFIQLYWYLDLDLVQRQVHRDEHIGAAHVKGVEDKPDQTTVGMFIFGRITPFEQGAVGAFGSWFLVPGGDAFHFLGHGVSLLLAGGNRAVRGFIYFLVAFFFAIPTAVVPSQFWLGDGADAIHLGGSAIW